MKQWSLPDAGIRRAGDVNPPVPRNVRFTVRHSCAATGLNPEVESFRVNPEVDTSGSPMATTRIPMRFSCLLMGNVKWHIECTVLEMETAGELTRFPDTPTPLPKSVKR